MDSVTVLLESLTALLEYLDLLHCFKNQCLWFLLGHMHLSTCNINNNPHKLGIQALHAGGDQKQRFDLVWPNVVLLAVTVQ